MGLTASSRSRTSSASAWLSALPSMMRALSAPSASVAPMCARTSCSCRSTFSCASCAAAWTRQGPGQGISHPCLPCPAVSELMGVLEVHDIPAPGPRLEHAMLAEAGSSCALWWLLTSVWPASSSAVTSGRAALMMYCVMFPLSRLQAKAMLIAVSYRQTACARVVTTCVLNTGRACPGLATMAWQLTTHLAAAMLRQH